MDEEYKRKADLFFEALMKSEVEMAKDGDEAMQETINAKNQIRKENGEPTIEQELGLDPIEPTPSND